MNLLYKSITVLLFVLPFYSFAQSSDTTLKKSTELRGILLDANTKEPLPYANIVVQRVNRGTITNESGQFSLDTVGLLIDDSVSFQYIGYKTTSYLISEVFKMENVFLEEDIRNLKKVFVFSAPPNAKDIVKQVIENREKNYTRPINKQEIFFRSRNIEDITSMELKYKKSSISLLDEKMIKELEQKTPKHSTSYTDFLGELYYTPKKIDTVNYKLKPIKTVSLKEKEVADMEVIEQVFEEVFANTEEEEYWKLKTGIFSFEMEVNEPDSAKQSTRPKNSKETKSSLSSMNEATRYALLVDEDDWEFLYATGKYNYNLIGGTNVGPEDVYVIEFTPKGGGHFEGRMYVSVETYALIRADYAYAPGKIGTNVQLLGIGFKEDYFSGSILFGKADSTYQLKYCSKKSGQKVQIERNFAIVKKKKRFFLDKKMKEVKLGLDMKTDSDSSFELLVLSQNSITTSTFKNLKQAEYHTVQYVDQFDDSLWEGYSIIQPTEKMREYKKRDE